MRNGSHGFSEPRLYSHIEHLYAWKTKKAFYPIKVEISPVSMCNHKCAYCYTNFLGRKPQTLDADVLKATVAELADIGVKSLLFQGTGEPLLYKGLKDITHIAKQRGLSVALTTNGVLLDKHLDVRGGILKDIFSIRLSSLDSDAARYAKVHGCGENDWHRLVNNISYVAELKRKGEILTTLYSTLYVTEENVDHLYDIAVFLKELGIDIVNMSLASYGSRNGGEYDLTFVNIAEENTINKIKRLSDDTFNVSVNLPGKASYDERFYFNEWQPYSCEGIGFYTLIGSDGELYPCARHWGNKEYSYGSLYDNGFAKLWNDERRKAVFERINNEPIDHDECFVCLHGHINTHLRQLKKPSEWTVYL